MERCAIHPEERVQLFCKECDDKPVCNTCITNRHSGHRFRKSSEVRDKMLNKVREMREENTKTRQKLEHDYRRLKREISRQNDIKVRTVNEIKNRTKELEKLVERQGKQMEEKYKNLQEKHINNLQKNCECIKREIKKRSQFESELQRFRGTEKISDLASQLKLVTAPAADGIVVPEETFSYKFVPCKGYPQLDTFGDIVKDKEDHYDIIGRPTIREVDVAQPTENDGASTTPSRCSSFSRTSEAASCPSVCSEDELVETVYNRRRLPFSVSDRRRKESVPRTTAAYIVVSANPDQCCINNQKQKTITTINRFGKEVQEQILLSDEIGGFSHYLSNELLVCIPERKVIQRVDKYSVIDFINTAPLVPRCVQTALFDVGEIVAIVDDPGTSRCTTCSELVRYNNKGEEIRRVRNDTFGNDLFYSPDKISFNRTGTKMAVINPCGPGSSHLLILNKNSEPLWRYFGDMRAYEGHEKFDPSLLRSDTNMSLSDVVFDSKDNVVIADTKTNIVKILNHKMEPVRVLGTYKETPIALAMVHHTQTLWVRFDNGNLSVVNYIAPS